MTPKGIRVLAWLVTGHAVCAGLYWALLNVPESNAVMLAVSALLIAAVWWCAAFVNVTAAGWLVPGASFRDARPAAFAALVAFAGAALVFGVAWSVGNRVDAWHDAVRGEIDAWLIARLHTTHAGWLHRTIDVIVFLLQYVAGTSLAAAVLVSFTGGGLGAVTRGRWAAIGLGSRQLALTILAIGIFVALPMRLIYWRPASLPATWVQPVFASVKLAVVVLLVHVGWMIVLAGAAMRVPSAGAAPSTPPV